MAKIKPHTGFGWFISTPFLNPIFFLNSNQSTWFRSITQITSCWDCSGPADVPASTSFGPGRFALKLFGPGRFSHPYVKHTDVSHFKDRTDVLHLNIFHLDISDPDI